jgi:metallo-beta-lactamase class B
MPLDGVSKNAPRPGLRRPTRGDQMAFAASAAFAARAAFGQRRGRSSWVALVGLAGVLAVLAAPAAAQETSEEERAWNQPVEPFRIAGNVYYVGAHEVASYLIATPEGHVVLDSGFEATVPQILANVERLGFRVADVKWILNSHAHYDHCGGLATLRERTGARIVMSAADAELAARGGEGDPNFGDGFRYRAFTPDRTIGDGEVVELGGTRLVAQLTPGHTRGCTTWTVRVEENGKPLEVAFLCSVTAPGYRLVGNAGHPTIVEDYRETFRRLAALPVDVFLANHGSFFDLHGKRERLESCPPAAASVAEEGAAPVAPGGEAAVACGAAAGNPFVDPAGWQRHVERQREAFEKRLAEQRAAAGG